MWVQIRVGFLLNQQTPITPNCGLEVNPTPLSWFGTESPFKEHLVLGPVQIWYFSKANDPKTSMDAAFIESVR